MKHYLYKKEKNNFYPVNDEALNIKAKRRLDEILENKETIGVPTRLLKKWDYVALFQSNGDINKANALYILDENSSYDLSNKLNDLTAKEWLSETVTVFSQKGLGASNKDAQIEKQHPAPFSFQDVLRLINFFTKENHTVLDPFSGVASAMKACAFEKRNGVGIELNSNFHELGKERLKNEIPDDFSYKPKQRLLHADSLEYIKKIADNYFDFIITSPPYWNILETLDHKGKQRMNNKLAYKYSEEDKDLSNIERYEDFLDVLSNFFDSCSRILKNEKYMCIIVSDFRKKDKFYTFHADLAKKIEKKNNFKLKGIRILYQRHKSIYPYGYPFSFVPNVHHQNVLIFQNIKK
ncbi:MAG: hypothetical protein K9I68_08150 [Bacteroidales bacterium]|nr:hypothetical protein [Bacteroidales bacterium]MCF8338398.1 hypothetical protein [Bacteroidales bacterium]